MEKIETLISLLLSLIAGGTAIYKLIIKGTHIREQKYYDNILLPFVTNYKQKTDIDCIDFIKKRVTEEDEYVPKYVFYLMSQSRNEDLRKILLNDYYELYNNDRNTLLRIAKYFEKFVFFAYFFIVIYFLGAGVMITVLGSTSIFVSMITSILQGSISILKTNLYKDIKRCIFGGVCILIGFVLMKINYYNNTDWYSIKIKEIERMIKKKKKYYEKSNKKNYI